MNQIIQVPDIAIVKTKNGTKHLHSLRDQKVAKSAALRSFDTGSGVKFGGNLYVLDSPEIEIVRMTTGRVDPLFNVTKTSDITVDWGDGVVEKNVFAHTYTDGVAEHNIVFWGKRTALVELKCTNNNLVQLDISNNIALIDLSCSENQLTQLDVSKNTLLEELLCEGNPFTSDLEKITSVANALPDRTGKKTGRFEFRNQASIAAVQTICGGKNWNVS